MEEEYETTSSCEKTLSADLWLGWWSILCVPFVSELSAIFSFWLRSLLFLAQDINHYSCKTKILATSAQNFCNETKEIQTNLFWGFTLASWKDKFKTKRKRLRKNCAICFIFDVKKSPRGSDTCLFNKWL